MSVLKQLISQHKRVIFDGDNYSEEWHAEAERRGLPNLKDSVAAFAVLRQKKNIELFKKYGVLTQAELDSRTHIAVEKYIKQIGIEAETMVSMARNQILPAALQHQQRIADAIAATKAAGVDCDDSIDALRSFVDLVTRLRTATGAVERASAHHDDRSDAARESNQPRAQTGDGATCGRWWTRWRRTSRRSCGRCRRIGICCF